jgi:hypothetical protein
MSDTVTDQDVFAGVHNALRREFGSVADVQEVSPGDGTTPAVFGFTVDGVDYSLSVNVTP